MPTPTPSEIDLVLRLYEQRREPELRRARDWMLAFWPKTYADVQAVMDGLEGKKAGRYWRMAVSYWEMIAAVMQSGGVSPEGRALFVETTREFFFVYGKIRPFYAEIRAATTPLWGRRLEEFCRSLPEHDQLLAYFEKRRAVMNPGRAPTAKGKKL
jgi:hypothetical protein